MQLVVHAQGIEREFDVALAEGATLGTIGAALAGDAEAAPRSLFVDGRLFSTDLPLADVGMVAGAVLSQDASHSEARGVVDLRVIAGPGAGMSVRLAPGTHVIGSGVGATIALRAPGVASRHAVLRVGAGGDVDVTSLGGVPHAVLPVSRVRIGASLVECVPAPKTPDEPLRAMPNRRGTVPYNRPPRRSVDHAATPIPLPDAPVPPASRARIGLAALIVPVLFGLTMAIVVHPRMALFAFLGPVMMLASWLDDRRRARRFRRTSASDVAAAAEQLGRAVDRAQTVEVLRRHRWSPPLPELVGRTAGGSQLWERRPQHNDFMQVVVGYGRPVWRPPLAGDPLAVPKPAREALADRRRLPTVPVTVDLGVGRVTGIAGSRTPAIDLARGLVVQAAVLHGPADLRIAVVTDRPATWDWTKWLPHTVSDGGGARRLLASTPEELAQLATMLAPAVARGAPGALLHPAAPGDVEEPLTLLVVDVPDLAAPSATAVRRLLAGRCGPVAGIVVAESRTRLPSVCTSVALVDGGGTALCSATHDGDVAVLAAGVGDSVARRVARSLARFDDPERQEAGAELPAAVSLLDLLGMATPTAAAVAARWAAGGTSPRLAAPLGVTESGVLVVDIVADGPHALVGGTTGSGKSELLRTLVATLAATVDPEHLNFVLIDYKGGSAFDAAAMLPHTVGLVTDLDDRLAERALRCLEAELRHREERLRDAGAGDLAAFLATNPAEPLPRMLIVIDEFAALAKELPDFMDALVDIAARGRSLGVHLVLATQRPAGVIRDNVRANTNLRIALRVQDRADSTDVIGDPGAAAIGRTQPGRGFVRLGPGEVVPFQAASVTGSAGEGSRPRIRMRPFRFAVEQEPFATADGISTEPGEHTQLELIVAAICAAASGMRPPRRPWPEPLPLQVSVAELPSEERPGRWSVPVGLRDEPERQRQVTHWWSPDDGSLVLYGLVGAGTTTALGTIAVGLAETAPPGDLHLYVLDFDAGGTTPLSGLPHAGAVVGPAERERQIRLIRRLAGEVERRKDLLARAELDLDTEWPRIVLFVDNFAGFSAAFDAPGDGPIKDALGRVVTDGPGVGVVSVLTASRSSGVPVALAGAVPNKLVFRMADPLAATMLGLRRLPSDLPVGRAIDVATRSEIQVALADGAGLAAAVAAVAAGGPAHGRPSPIEELPIDVPVDRVAARVRVSGDHWFIPVGIGDADLEVVGFALGPGDHVLVAGEARSGRSTALCAIAKMAAATRRDLSITVVALRPSPLREVAGSAVLVTEPDQLAAAVAGLDERPGPQLVLIDDADVVDDSGVLKGLAASRRPDVHVVAAARRDLKTQYQHWAKDLCRSRVGLWLRPSPGLDGDLWSTPMPRHIPPGMPPGRGFLVADGSVELVQTARP